MEDVVLIACGDRKKVPPESANSCIFYYLHKIDSPNLILNGCYTRQLCLSLYQNVDRKDSLEGGLVLSLCNRFVKKTFHEGVFFGYIVSFDYPFYLVKKHSLCLIIV
jgi:hypothetical protein